MANSYTVLRKTSFEQRAARPVNILRTLFLASMFLFTACATQESHYSFSDAPVPQESYSETIEKWTSDTKAYNGVTSTYQVAATLNSMEMTYQQVYHDAIDGHLTRDQYLEARKKAEDDAEKQTTFFVALYTERDENNDLDKIKTLWNVFLDVHGKRVMPKSIKRVYEKRDLLLSKYPYLTPWSRQYIVTFPVRVKDCTEQPVVLTLASPLGAAYLQFPQ